MPKCRKFTTPWMEELEPRREQRSRTNKSGQQSYCISTISAIAPALLSVAAPGATLPPPSLESYLPASNRQATDKDVGS